MKFYQILLIFFSCLCFSVNIQQFQRSNTLTYEMLEDARVKNSHVFNDYDLALTLGFSYVDEPLTVKDPANTTQFRAAIEKMSTTFYSSFRDDLGEKRSGLGDLNLNLTWRFLLRKRYALALMPFASIPTASSGADSDINLGTTALPVIRTMNPLGDDSVGYGALLIYEHFFNFMNFVVNVGYKKSEDAIFQELDLRERLITGIGAYIPIKQTWGVNIEYKRDWSMPIGDNINPNELYLGTSFGVARNIAGFAGVGFGNLLSDKDGNDYRISAGLKFTPRVWSPKRKAIKPVRIIKKTKKHIYSPENLINLEEDTGIDLGLADCNENAVFDDYNTYVVRFPHDIGVIISPDQLEYITESINARRDEIEKILVTGHTSAPGADSYNMSLSKKRAISVAQLLVNKGIPKKIVFFRGKGETMLIDNSGTKEAEEINRRVEIKAILKNQPSECK